MTTHQLQPFYSRLGRFWVGFWQRIPFGFREFLGNPVAWLLLLLLFGMVTRPIFDPDLGWHIRAGMDFWKNHWVAYTDPYSWTMPNWKWVDHEWLTDALLAPWYRLTASIGTSLVYGALVTATFLIATSLRPTRIASKVLSALIAGLAGLVVIGARQQMVTLFGLALLLWIFYRYREGKIRHLWWLPLMFLLWANMHGGFIAGFLALGVIGVVEIIKTWLYHARQLPLARLSEPVMSWGQIRHCVIVVLLCVAATFINPYGFDLYRDIYLTLSDKFVLASILEWQKVTLLSTQGWNFLAYLILLAAVLVLTYRRIEPTRWALMIVFLYLALEHWRHLPFFMLISIGLMAELIDQYAGPLLDYLQRNTLLLVALVGAIVPIMRDRYHDVITRGLDFEGNFIAQGMPIQAIDWLKSHPDQIGKRMYNLYGWGGLIIWQFPEQKVFIDGRMPYWRDSSHWPFYDHQMINMGGSQAPGLLQHYDVDWMLIPADQPLDRTLFSNPDWQAVYNDDIAVIYTRKDVLTVNR